MCSVPHNTFLYYAHTTQYGLVPQRTRSWVDALRREARERVRIVPVVAAHEACAMCSMLSLVLLCAGRGSLLSLDFTSENVIRYPSHVALYLVPYGARRPSHHPSVTRR